MLARLSHLIYQTSAAPPQPAQQHPALASSIEMALSASSHGGIRDRDRPVTADDHGTVGGTQRPMAPAAKTSGYAESATAPTSSQWPMQVLQAGARHHTATRKSQHRSLLRRSATIGHPASDRPARIPNSNRRRRAESADQALIKHLDNTPRAARGSGDPILEAMAEAKLEDARTLQSAARSHHRARTCSLRKRCLPSPRTAPVYETHHALTGPPSHTVKHLVTKSNVRLEIQRHRSRVCHASLPCSCPCP